MSGNTVVPVEPPTDARPTVPGDLRAAGAVGRYRYDLSSATWWWSPELFALCRLAPGSAQPSLELLLAHQHPEDRDRIVGALRGACLEGRSFCLEARLRVDGERPRKVVLLGEPKVDEDGGVTGVSGLLAEPAAEPTGAEEREALLSEIQQLRTAMASRASIEQAKGIIMLLTGCGEEVAFRLLAHISSHTHRKVREVAVAITESAAGHGRLPDDVRAILRDACPPGSGRG